MKNYFSSVCLTLCLISVGCAKVPKEAVELSATVGRDIAELRKSHLNLLKLHYDGLISNVNKFIDDVYLPYQIQKTLSDPTIKNLMLSSIEAASKDDVTGSAQKGAFQNLKNFHIIIHNEIEDYRAKKLQPIQTQYKTLLLELNDSYDQVHYANSIVTGHLASVVQVHDAQSELLKETKLNGLRQRVSGELVIVSEEISELIESASKKDADLDKLINKFNKVSEKLK